MPSYIILSILSVVQPPPRPGGKVSASMRGQGAENVEVAVAVDEVFEAECWK
jgi:hypothetical protein